jgi:hypothetical protein
MNKRLQKRSQARKSIAFLAMALLLGIGLVFSATVQPVLANTFQAVTSTATSTVTRTVTATVAGSGTPSATTVSTGTAVATLAEPTNVGTPTALVPVTGADLASPRAPGNPSALLLRIAVGLAGLLLIGFGLRSRLVKR